MNHVWGVFPGCARCARDPGLWDLTPSAYVAAGREGGKSARRGTEASYNSPTRDEAKLVAASFQLAGDGQVETLSPQRHKVNRSANVLSFALSQLRPTRRFGVPLRRPNPPGASGR